MTHYPDQHPGTLTIMHSAPPCRTCLPIQVFPAGSGDLHGDRCTECSATRGHHKHSKHSLGDRIYLGRGHGDVIEFPLSSLWDRSDEEELPAILGEHWFFILWTEAMDRVY